MTAHTVLTAIGPDRPGLVEAVSEFVLARGGSIEGSRMANLGGQFAIMMLVAAPADAAARLADEVEGLGSSTSLDVRLTPASGRGAAAAEVARYRLQASALDQVGLVHEVANVLRRCGANIESMDTVLQAAPETGAPTFAMDIVVSVPVSTATAELRDAVAQACDRLDIDWDLTEVPPS